MNSAILLIAVFPRSEKCRFSSRFLSAPRPPTSPPPAPCRLALRFTLTCDPLLCSSAQRSPHSASGCLRPSAPKNTSKQGVARSAALQQFDSRPTLCRVLRGCDSKSVRSRWTDARTARRKCVNIPGSPQRRPSSLNERLPFCPLRLRLQRHAALRLSGAACALVRNINLSQRSRVLCTQRSYFQIFIP